MDVSLELEQVQKHSGEHKMEVSVIEVDQCSWRREERNGCVFAHAGGWVDIISLFIVLPVDSLGCWKTEIVEYKF